VALANGTRLGPYKVLDPIGAGGMGEVYRAHDTRLGRDVAIKVLPEDTAQMPDRLARFEREARAVAALNHPNILALHDIGNESGIVYVVMELLQGDTLRDRLLATGRLSPSKAINYATQIARGLAAAHDRGIVHRDLKPANLFITTDGRVKILDFGLAHRGAESEEADHNPSTRLTTEPGTIIGTPHYMSPEQVFGQPATPRSDLFAFGVIVFEMLTGKHPFMRKTMGDTVAAIVREEAPSMSGVLDLPPGIGAIVANCLEKQAAARPVSARDIAMFLEAAGASHEPDAWRRIAASDLRRMRNRIVAIVCGLLVLVSATTWMLVRTMTNRAVASAIDVDLDRASRLMTRVQRERLSALALTARQVASFPELRALFATDAPTIRDYLLSYQQRNPGAPLLIAIGADGTAIARTDVADAGGGDTDNDWFAALVQPRGEPAVVEIRDRPFHAAAAVADSGGTVFGYIVGAMAIGDEFAASIREVTQDEIILLSDTDVLASTLRGDQPPWRSRSEWLQAGGSAEQATDVRLAGHQFAAREVRLADRPVVSGIVLRSRNEVVARLRSIETMVVAIGLFCAAVAAAGTLWITRIMSPRTVVGETRTG